MAFEKSGLIFGFGVFNFPLLLKIALIANKNLDTVLGAHLVNNIHEFVNLIVRELIINCVNQNHHIRVSIKLKTLRHVDLLPRRVPNVQLELALLPIDFDWDNLFGICCANIRLRLR